MSPLYFVLSAVAVAQLVESQIVILVVVGSSPISHPKTPQVLDFQGFTGKVSASPVICRTSCLAAASSDSWQPISPRDLFSECR